MQYIPNGAFLTEPCIEVYIFLRLNHVVLTLNNRQEYPEIIQFTYMRMHMLKTLLKPFALFHKIY